MADILKGKPVIDNLNIRLKEKCGAMQALGIFPTLAVVRVGSNSDDIAYERGAEKSCSAAGIRVVKFHFDESITQGELIQNINALNVDNSIHGVLILRPLPGHISDIAVCRSLLAEKDVDGITEYSMAGVYSDKTVGFAPCTAEACIDMLEHYGIDIAGKRAAVVGRSFVVGRPVAMMLLKHNATVTICHRKTKNLAEVCRNSDILIVAAGHAHLIDRSCMSQNQIIIDIGINFDKNGNMCGDVDFDAACETVRAVTPVPGGIGRITSAIVAKHVIDACLRANNMAK